MTDAAVPVTQSAVENFTARYLQSLGCQVEIRDNEWQVTIPEDVETDLPKGEHALVCGTAEDLDETYEQLHPESSFFQSVLDDASDRAPLGVTRIDAIDTDIIVPDWLQESSISVSNIDFTPYYDRSALVVLFRLSVETVSEYQQEFLRSIGIDIRSKEILPNIDETFLTLTQSETAPILSRDIAVEPEQVERLVDASREPLLSEIQPQIDEIHQGASRAADAELEEYRQLQRQREEELETEITHLRSKIDDLNESIDDKNQTERVEALKERRECKSKLQEVETELNELRRRREQGYPDQQREIRDRHGLEVVVTPVTVTEIEYERGDATFELTDCDLTRTLTVGYGSGVGVTEAVDCDSCGQSLSGEDPLGAITNGVRCMACRG
ncbi:hypothetical protein [Natronoglomus mannanivorans]|uniref:Uncharacterized protein n=1 Tax=Natronoglomus mannanivorans TaxID=2979990 RepID=A0AAP2Z3K1_9EURY|nr:hypothetical protein [Halobacteria archaeon AArc-xg1-1]